MRVVWSEGAQANLIKLVDYIARDNVAAALDMEDRIRASIRRLREFPQSGRIGSQAATFELVVPRSPYIVIYRLREDEIGIVRILHGAQQWPSAQ